MTRHDDEDVNPFYDEADPDGVGPFDDPDRDPDGGAVGDAGAYPGASGTASDRSAADRDASPTDRPEQSTPADAGTTTDDDDDTPTWKIEGMVFALVAGQTTFHALARAKAGLTRTRTAGDTSAHALPQSDQSVRAVDDITDDLADRFIDRWGDLDSAISLADDRGQDLLATILVESEFDPAPDSDPDVATTTPDATHLYDDAGEPITETATIDALRDQHPADELFLVPAMVLKRWSDRGSSGPDRGRERPSSPRGRCPNCETKRRFTFSGMTETPEPDEDLHPARRADIKHYEGGDPIWECTTCGFPRYGRPQSGNCDDEPVTPC